MGEEKLSGSGTLWIESLAEGLRARSVGPENRYYAIQSGPNGGLTVNRLESWPMEKVYSIMTGEPVSLNVKVEEST